MRSITKKKEGKRRDNISSSSSSRRNNRRDKDKDADNKDNKILVSFQIKAKLWQLFDEIVEWQYGKYKKSLILENEVEKYCIKWQDKYWSYISTKKENDG